ncbi:MAG: hypothetical protein V3V12_02250 [Gammaproteobacteria bacterium]
MNIYKPTIFGLFFVTTNAFSGGVALSENDCLDILERWAADPGSVPAHMVNHCRDMLAAGGPAIPMIEPAAGKQRSGSEVDLGLGDKAASSIVEDPCSSASAPGSVHCWGPWTSLAPAAGPLLALPTIDSDPDVRPEVRSTGRFIIDDGVVPVPDTPLNNIILPLGACQAGQSCGFATLVDGVTTRPDNDPATDDTLLTSFDLEQDASQFTVDPNGPNELASNGNMQPNFRNDPDGNEDMRSIGTIGSTESTLTAGVFRDEKGNILQSIGDWVNGDIISSGGERRGLSGGHSGKQVWGIASSQATLDALNNGGQGVSVTYSGAMSVDPATQAVMQVNFGAQPNWTGQWTNPGYDFSAGGSVTGVDLISDPTQFSSNVQQDNSYVQGALLGEKDDLSLINAVDVKLDTGRTIKDVGLLRSGR